MQVQVLSPAPNQGNPNLFGLPLFRLDCNGEEPLAVAPQQQSFARYRRISFHHLIMRANIGSDPCHPHQISTVIMIRNRVVKAVLGFYREALIYKAFLVFGVR